MELGDHDSTGPVDDVDQAMEWVLDDDALPRAATVAQAVEPACAHGPADTVRTAWHLRQRNTHHALALVALAEASAHPESLAPQLAGRCALVRAEAAWLRGEPIEARRVLAVANAQFLQADAARGLSDAAWLLAQLAGDEGSAAERDQALIDARRHAERAGDLVRATHATLAIAFEEAVREPHGAEVCWRETVQQALSSGEAAWRPWALMFFGFLSFQRSDYVDAIRRYAAAQDAAQRVGMLRRAIVCQLTVAASFANLQDKEQGLEWAQRALDLARSTQWPGSIGTCLLTVGATLRELGRLQGAAAVLEEALVALGTMTGSRNEALALNYRGAVHLDSGEPEAALALFDRVAVRARALGLEEIGGYAQEGRARALLALGRIDEAMEAARSAMASAQALGATDSIVDALMIAADIQMRGGECGTEHGAMALLQQALVRARTVAQGIVQPELLDRLARCAAETGDHREAYAYATQAADARARIADEAAMQRVQALEVKLDTERARAEAERQRQVAIAESERAQLLPQAHATLERLAEAGRAITLPRSMQAVCRALQWHAREMLGVARAQVTEAHTAPSGTEDFDVRVAADGLTHEVVAALKSGEGLQGLLHVYGLPGQRIGERERLVLHNLCAFGAVAMGHARAFQSLQAAHAQLAEASITDPLTGMHNRRYLLQHIDADVEWSLRQWQNKTEAARAGGVEDAELLFLIGDLDHFKLLNDTWGHAAGDEVLRLLLPRLRPEIRAFDHLVRWGGEEILVVARGTARSEARALAERLRRAISDKPFVLADGRQLCVTASFGWASFPWNVEHPRGTSWAEVLKRADEALYRAKAKGRNACVGRISDGKEDWIESA